MIAETAGGGPTGTTGTTREYIWLYETEISPTMGSRTVVDRPLAVVSAVNTASAAIYWVSVDHLNRPIKMTTSAKVSVWDAVWQPWGGIHSITGSATLDARFPGQWFQVETGLHYNWHRSYDPTLGRYTQPDPLGFVDGPSVYGYNQICEREQQYDDDVLELPERIGPGEKLRQTRRGHRTLIRICETKKNLLRRTI